MKEKSVFVPNLEDQSWLMFFQMYLWSGVKILYSWVRGKTALAGSFVKVDPWGSRNHE